VTGGINIKLKLITQEPPMKNEMLTREKYNVFDAGLKFERKAKIRHSSCPVTRRTDILSPAMNMTRNIIPFFY